MKGLDGRRRRLAGPGARHTYRSYWQRMATTWATRPLDAIAASDIEALRHVISHQPGPDHEPLEPQGDAVELLNIIRPTVAVSWFVAFTAHALHRWPEHRVRLRDGDIRYAVAFAHETRRFYPFAPFLGGRAVTDLTWQGHPIAAGSLVLLDIFGQNHDPLLWPDSYRFQPQRFLDREPDPDELIPQGGADATTGHRCPGEDRSAG